MASISPIDFTRLCRCVGRRLTMADCGESGRAWQLPKVPLLSLEVGETAS